MKKRLLSITATLLAVLLLLPLAGCGSKTSIEDLKTAVSDSSTSIQEQTVYLSNMAKFTYNYWSTLNNLNGTIDYEETVSKAYEWLSENSDATRESIENAHKEICAQYKAVITMEVDEPEANKIIETYEELFNTYNDLYLATTGLGGDINAFVDKHNECVNSIESLESVLSILISE